MAVLQKRKDQITVLQQSWCLVSHTECCLPAIHFLFGRELDRSISFAIDVKCSLETPLFQVLFVCVGVYVCVFGDYDDFGSGCYYAVV